MSAADHREELEARCWQAGLSTTQVDGILAAADRYAEAAADGSVIGRLRLARAAAAVIPAVHYPSIIPGGTACNNGWKYPPRRITADLGEVTCTRCRHGRGYQDALWAREQGAAA